MYMKNCVTSFLLFIALVVNAPPAVARVIPAGMMRHPAVRLRQADIVADAMGRAIDAEQERLNYRGVLPRVQVSMPRAVTATQLAALGFKGFSPAASGVLVQSQVHDASGTWDSFYVYDPTTHFMRLEMERLTLDRRSTQIRRRL